MTTYAQQQKSKESRKSHQTSYQNQQSHSHAHSVNNFCIFNCFMFPIFTKRNLKDFFTIYTFKLFLIMKLHNPSKELTKTPHMI